MPSTRLTVAVLAASLLSIGALYSRVVSPPAIAEEIHLGPLVISGLWTRATPPGAPTAAGYLTIANAGTADDRLVAVASSRAEVAEVHEMRHEGDRMTMRPVPDGIVIPAGGGVTLAPSGYHLMFIGIGEGFRPDTEVPVTLTFERAGSVDAVLPVLPIGSRGPAAEHAMPTPAGGT